MSKKTNNNNERTREIGKKLLSIILKMLSMCLFQSNTKLVVKTNNEQNINENELNSNVKGELIRSMNEMCLSYEKLLTKLHVVSMELAQYLVMRKIH